VALVALNGCLVAPPIEREPDQNRPFAIDPDGFTPSPAESISTVLGPRIEISFSATTGAVIDPDGDDIVYAWYLYAAGSRAVLDDNLLFSTYAFAPCAFAGLDVPATLLLELVASDRRPDSKGADGQYDFPDDAQTATVAWWWINVTDGGSCSE